MNIFVGNIAWSAGDADLRAAFEEYGQVDSAKIIMDRESGRSRGFGFVEMSDDSAANQAIEGLNGTSLMGRDLRVNEARPREERPRR
ncbi:RNA-binding protein [Salinisphaera sp. USBA-960]|uniref:RNA recognition motif domain-containing protein n=1 Tax=Salinisphaera orenii TaxID=856731 RepID=UPI000DBE0E88|nr:RNA-binding protein [Salifodinibacter halophilus]NNC27225.1 RNA-binding protein [Salifodinibacter halophilus]